MRVPASLKAFGSLVPALRPEWPGMVRSYVIGTISAMSLVALTVLSAWAVGHAVVDRVLPGPVLWLGLGGLVLARTVLTWREMDVSHALAYRVLARLRMALFEAYARSVPGKKREHSGRVASVAMDDIEKLEFFYAHTIAQVATSITVFLASAITALAILPPAGGVVVLGGAVIATSAFYWAHTARRLGAAEQHERTEMSAGIVDALGALREVLAYNLTSRVVHDTREATARATTIARRREMLAQLVTSVRELTVTAVVIGVIATSAISAGVLDGSGGEAMSAAVLPALIALSIAGVSAVTDATTTVTQLHPLTASAERVSAGIHRAPVVRTPETKRALPDGSLGLRFDHVSFSYEDRKPTLRSFTAEIEPGEHVGLSGASGAGKSTIIALASRLWDPDGGAIEFRAEDGTTVPATEIDDDDLRQAVAVVDQEATLFHGSVRDNLIKGTRTRPDHELENVLAQVGAAEWISLDDQLGQGGVRLSGGQQARLCLARALARSPRILLVDEVTASLDPTTEHDISQVLADFPGTVLFASHRHESLARTARVIRIESA
ncbi:ABC transporter ATP-binding protein [Brevibacterium picturae]|uniref:ABC transporter ATP-binding protein n=1 Tax=Brevibacterium picturae TaxID=260553 RepID=A0ABN2B270_9MICO